MKHSVSPKLALALALSCFVFHQDALAYGSSFEGDPFAVSEEVEEEDVNIGHVFPDVSSKRTLKLREGGGGGVLLPQDLMGLISMCSVVEQYKIITAKAVLKSDVVAFKLRQRAAELRSRGNPLAEMQDSWTTRRINSNGVELERVNVSNATKRREGRKLLREAKILERDAEELDLIREHFISTIVSELKGQLGASRKWSVKVGGKQYSTVANLVTVEGQDMDDVILLTSDSKLVAISRKTLLAEDSARVAIVIDELKRIGVSRLEATRAEADASESRLYAKSDAIRRGARGENAIAQAAGIRSDKVSELHGGVVQLLVEQGVGGTEAEDMAARIVTAAMSGLPGARELSIRLESGHAPTLADALDLRLQIETASRRSGGEYNAMLYSEAMRAGGHLKDPAIRRKVELFDDILRLPVSAELNGVLSSESRKAWLDSWFASQGGTERVYLKLNESARHRLNARMAIRLDAAEEEGSYSTAAYGSITTRGSRIAGRDIGERIRILKLAGGTDDWVSISHAIGDDGSFNDQNLNADQKRAAQSLIGQYGSQGIKLLLNSAASTSMNSGRRVMSQSEKRAIAERELASFIARVRS